MSGSKDADFTEVARSCLEEIHLIQEDGLWGFLSIPQICDEILGALTEDETFHAVSIGRYPYWIGRDRGMGLLIEGLNQHRQECSIHIYCLPKWDSEYCDSLPRVSGNLLLCETIQRKPLRKLKMNGRGANCCPWETEYRILDPLNVTVCISKKDVIGKRKGRYLAEVPFVKNDFPNGTMAAPTLFINAEYADQSPSGRLLALLENPYDPKRRGHFPLLEAMLDYYREKIEEIALGDAALGKTEKFAKILAVKTDLEGGDSTLAWRFLYLHPELEELGSMDLIMDHFFLYSEKYGRDRCGFAEPDTDMEKME